MPAKNPFDEIKSSLVDEMTNMSNEWKGMAKGVPPFQSAKPTPQEDRFIFENPRALYQGYTHPRTMQPVNNAQAAQLMLDGGELINKQGQPEKVYGMGAQRYVDWVDSHARRIDAEHADPSTGDPVVTQQGTSFGAEGGLSDLAPPEMGGA